MHPKGGFPAVSLLFMGIASAIASIVSLENLIAVLIVVQILFQYTAQCFAVVALRRQTRANAGSIFRMPLYPLPIVITLVGWLFIVGTSRPIHVAAAFGMMALGALVFLALARRETRWPFAR